MENQLTRKEEQIMLILWKLRRAFVKDIISQLPDPKPPYNTISSVVRILVQKGFVSYKTYGKTHEYFPLVSITTYRKTALNSFISHFYENSNEQFIASLLSDLDLSREELEKFKSSSS